MTWPLILVVEDEPAIADSIVYALATDGFEPLWCASLAAARDALAAREPALAVLDVGLPDGSGFDFFKTLQRERPGLPALFLTARSAEIDRVVGLELGADDYVTKPFSPREMVARIRTILRRAQGGAARAAAADTARFAVDDERKQIRCRGQPLELSRIEYRLLKVLVERPGRVFTRDELMNRAWDDPAGAFDRTVDAHVKMLRAKLRAIAPDEDPIVTHRGTGYALRESADP
ncbi:MAG: two-component system response regulator CreB [Betaproteobacteria bacterium]|jgi:two-component system catabolic regulation response regulator CreB|nr:two-component system response regulator CreB [Burkholderiales bacterium]MCE2645710.1 two-component system response regulator CreB [Burkholderiaceae bacterium]